MSMTDGELVALVREGDHDAYGRLVQRHQASLYRYALGMVSSADAAADIVQDSLVRAFTRLESCSDPDRFGAWTFRILRNACLDYLKNRRRRDVSLEEDALFTSDDDPLREVERAELGSAIGAALTSLPAPQRDAFLMKHVDDLSYDEMSVITGSSVSALKMRVMRAREALHSLLADRSPVGL